MRLSKNETKKQKLLTKDQMIEKMRKIMQNTMTTWKVEKMH